MAKYCPYMSHQNKWQEDVECYGKECAWADKDGTCLIAKALKQITDPISALAQGYPTAPNVNHFIDYQYHTTTTTPVIDLPHTSPNISTIDYPYRPLKLKIHGEEE